MGDSECDGVMGLQNSVWTPGSFGTVGVQEPGIAGESRDAEARHFSGSIIELGQLMAFPGNG